MMKKKYLNQFFSYMMCVCMVFSFTVGYANTTVHANNQVSEVTPDWALSHVDAWLENGIIKGFSDGTIRPNQEITRAEFMTLVNRAYGFQKQSDVRFLDVSSKDWFYEDVAIAVAAGYIIGNNNNTVKPRDLITRQEAAIIMSRLLKLPKYAEENGIRNFTDYGHIAKWSKEAINSVVIEGYMLGSPDGLFRPDANITRAETVVTLSRATGEIFNYAGIYDDNKTIKGNATINTTGIELENVTIEGNLYLTPGIGDGTVSLRHVTVLGKTVISGGGENSVTIEDCDLNEVFISREDGKIKVIISGNFGTVHLINPEIKLYLIRGSIENLIVAETAVGVQIDLSDNTVVKNLVLNALATITGEGTIESEISDEAVPEAIPTGGTPSTSSDTPSTPGGTPSTPGDTPSTPGGTPSTPGDTIDGKLTPPTLIADTIGNFSKTNLDILFADNSAWRSAVTGVKVNGTLLTANTQYELSAGKLRLKTHTIPAMQGTGDYMVTMDATNYHVATLSQKITQELLGSGTASEPYQVATATDLDKVRYYVGVSGLYFIQTADIDLNTIDWQPIGVYDQSMVTDGEPFMSHYNGNNYYIENMKITYNSTTFSKGAGLFRNTIDANLSNIRLNGVNIDVPNTGSVGALVGEAKETTITGCVVENSTKVKGLQAVGGLVGYGYRSTISSSRADVWVYGEASINIISNRVGGFIGDSNNSSITSSSAHGKVFGDKEIGGFVGRMDYGSITSCFSDGQVTGTGDFSQDTGGFVGINYHATANQCYAISTVSGRNYVGGFAGRNIGTITNSYARGSVAYTGTVAGGFVGRVQNNAAHLLGGAPSNTGYNYSDVAISGSGTKIGAFLGEHDTSAPGGTGTIHHNHYNLGIAMVNQNGGANGLTLENMNKQDSFPEWDFSTIWTIQEDVTTPYHKWQTRSVYDIHFDPTGVVAGIGKSVDITLKAMEVRDEGYDLVRIQVSVINKPLDATVALIGNYGAGPVDVIALGYWGPEVGHTLSKDYDETYPLIASFSKPGNYTLDICLRDRIVGTDILRKTVVVTVTEQFTLMYSAGLNGRLLQQGIVTPDFNEVYEEVIQQTVLSGESGIAVTAVPDAGYAFLKWSDESTEISRIEMNVIENLSFEAIFIETVGLGLRHSPGSETMGIVTDLDGLSFVPGEVVVLSATAEPGYVFVGWYDVNGVLVDGNEHFNYSVPDNTSQLFATFATAEPFILQYSAGNNGKVQVLKDSLLEDQIIEEIQYGSDSTGVKAIPNSGYMFQSWSDGRQDNPRIEYGVTRNYNAIANFVEIPNIQLTPPVINPDTTHNYAGNKLVVYPERGFFGIGIWLSKIDSIKVNEQLIDSSAYHIDPLFGQISLKTELIAGLQVPGEHTVKVYAAGYAPSVWTQTITAGIAYSMEIETLPQGPTSNEGYFDTAPVVRLLDSYNNLCADGPSAQTPVYVKKDNHGTGSMWLLSGSTEVTTVAGIAHFSALMAKNTSSPLLPVTDARLIFNIQYLASLEKTSANFSIGTSENPFNGVWIYPDEEENYAGEVLELEYLLGHYTGNWETAVTMQVNGKNIPRFATSHTPPFTPVLVWSTMTIEGKNYVRIDTSYVPELQKQGYHEITFSAAGYDTGTVIQRIKANVAAGLKILNSPIGPQGVPGSDPAGSKELLRQPDVLIVDKYGNMCYDGPSGDKQYAVFADPYLAYNWELTYTGIEKFVLSTKGEAHFNDKPLGVINSTRSDISDAKIRFSANGLGEVFSDTFDIPRGVYMQPNMTLDGQIENSILAGDTLIVRVYGVTPEWRYAAKTLYIGNIELGYNTDYIYVPEFSAFVIYAKVGNSLQRQGDKELIITAAGYVNTKFKFHVSANRAHSMTVHHVVGPAHRTIPNTNQYFPFISPVKASIYDRFGNLCVDGPSASGVMVTVEKETGKWNWIGTSATRTREAINGSVAFDDLYIDIYAGMGRIFGKIKVNATGLISKSVDFEMANWYTKYDSGYIHAHPTNETEFEAGTWVEFKINASDSQRWFDSIQYVTVDGYVVPTANYEKSYDGSITIGIDGSEVKQLQVAGEHIIKIHPIEFTDYLGPNIWGTALESFEYQVTILPGFPHRIQMIDQPRDLGESGENLTIALCVLDKFGNLTPSYVTAEVKSISWAFSGTTGIYAADGHAIFNITANNLYPKDLLASIRFHAGEIYRDTTAFYLPGIQ